MHPRIPSILHHLATVEAVPDAELLARFATSRDEAAFELLVWRHTGMVLRVCRGVLGDHHAAEDACQATFLALARHSEVMGRGSVAGWLYRVARRVALQAAIRTEVRAERAAGSSDLEDHLPDRGAPCGPDLDLVSALHDEVAGLPERYRIPVLLCFFEGLTHRAAAERLGMPIGTLAARVNRAQERLRRRLAARGYGGTAAVFAALATGTVAGSPTFVAHTTRAAVAFASAGVPRVSEAILKLAEGATLTMTSALIRLAVCVSILCGVALGGLWATGGQESPNPPKAAPAGVAAPPGVAPDANKMLDAWWADLMSDEPGVPERAVLALATRPKQTVPFLRDRLKPLKASKADVEKALTDLGSDKKAVWQPAFDQLQYYDPRLAIDLVTLMKDVTGTPARQRLVAVLVNHHVSPDEYAGFEFVLREDEGIYNFVCQSAKGNSSMWAEHKVQNIVNPRWLRLIRAVAVLEHVGTADAVAILNDLATGHPDARPTRAAKEALTRLGRKAP